MYGTIGLNDDGFNSGINNAKGQLNGLSSDFEKNSESLAKFQAGFTKFAIAAETALVATAGLAVKTGIDYESAFAGVRKTVDATEGEFQILSDGIRNMAKEVPMAATDIAALAESAGQLGIKTENILDFTKVVADLGVATNIVGQEGAAQIARFANIVGMSQDNFDEFGSSIVVLGNNFATTEAEILAMSMRLAGAGSQVGMTEADILGLATGLSSVGIEAEAGGSAFSKVIVQMQLAAELGGDKLEQFASVAGMTAEQFKEAYGKDATAALLAFVNGLNNTEANGKSAIAVLDEMEITEVRMRDALLRASGATDTFTDAIALGNTAWTENIALTREAEARYATTASQLTILKNQAKDVGISFFEMVQPALLTAVNGLSSGIEWLSNNLGIVLPIITALSVAIGGLAIVMNMSAMVKSVTLAWQGFNLALAANPIGAILIAITALVAGLVTLWKTNEDFRNAIINAWEKIKEAAIRNWGNITKFFTEDIPQAISGLPGKFLEIGGNIVSGFVEGIKAKIGAAIESIKGFFGGVVNSVKNVLGISSPSKVFAGIGTNVGEGFIEGVESTSSAINNSMNNIIDGAIDQFPQRTDEFIAAGENLMEYVGEGVVLKSEWLNDTVNGVIEDMVQSTNKYLDALTSKYSVGSSGGGGGGYRGGIVPGGGVPVDYLQSIYEQLEPGSYNAAYNVGKATADGYINGIKDTSTAAEIAAAGMAKSATNSAADALGVKSPSKVFEKLGEFTGQGFVNGLLNIGQSVKQTADNIFGNINGNYQVTPRLNLAAAGVNSVSSMPVTNITQYIQTIPQSPAELASTTKAAFDRARWA